MATTLSLSSPLFLVAPPRGTYLPPMTPLSLNLAVQHSTSARVVILSSKW